jgi:hypothetical protein
VENAAALLAAAADVLEHLPAVYRSALDV